MNVVVFIVLLGALILVHELGHFILAKRAGVKVEEFGIGFPPRLFAIQRGETAYSLNLIPLGGFVRMLGEEDPTAPRSFASASRWWRIAILVAGATMNFIVAILLFSGAYASGWPTVTKSEVIVSDVVSGSPAARAGLKTGDVIVKFAGQTIERPSQISSVTYASLGKSLPVVIQRGQQTLNLTVTPRTSWPSDQGPVGIGISEHPLKVEPVYYSLPKAIIGGITQTVQTVILTLSVPVLVIRGLIPADAARPIGPFGIYQITSQATTETVTTGWWFPVLSVAATVSAGLGFANLLPIPGLDGGRLLFVIIEAIRGRRISPQRESMIHMVGLVFLVSVFLIVTYFDVLFPVNLNFGPH
ncbi:MAG TPA: M50 family metallopeptidase [Chloroflexota bacterium]|nr:M50 family metallopeptidase [Chloroflexota bacterium]